MEKQSLNRISRSPASVGDLSRSGPEVRGQSVRPHRERVKHSRNMYVSQDMHGVAVS